MVKLQDLIFFLLLGGIFYLRNTRVAVFLGLACLILAIPLFTLKVFFTAERLVWYAAGFFLYSIIKQIYEDRR